LKTQAAIRPHRAKDVRTRCINGFYTSDDTTRKGLSLICAAFHMDRHYVLTWHESVTVTARCCCGTQLPTHDYMYKYIRHSVQLRGGALIAGPSVHSCAISRALVLRLLLYVASFHDAYQPARLYRPCAYGTFTDVAVATSPSKMSIVRRVAFTSRCTGC
jgi:hypothetical protein